MLRKACTQRLCVQVCEKADVLFVATKPQYVRVVLSENKATLASKLVVSIAAGVTCATLLGALENEQAKVIRVMPNTPCLVGATAAACAQVCFKADMSCTEQRILCAAVYASAV